MMLICDAAPASVDDAPASVDDAPAFVDGAPSSVDDAPSAFYFLVVDDAPSSVDDAPSSADDVPSSADDMQLVVYASSFPDEIVCQAFLDVRVAFSGVYSSDAGSCH